MDTFAPEFSRWWFSGGESDDPPARERHDDEMRAQEKALEELAERVSAARSIV
jgi:hypothetical protein